VTNYGRAIFYFSKSKLQPGESFEGSARLDGSV
jgi:hypothetical protein